MVDNGFTTKGKEEKVVVASQNVPISIDESKINVEAEGPISLVSSVAEIRPKNVNTEETPNVSIETKVVVSHTASDPNQHTIGAITGLRSELDYIKSLKTVYSNGVNVANYYEWSGGNSYNDSGYFVSLVPSTSTIKICDGADIFGVSVPFNGVGTGFVGGQDAAVSRDNKYGLIVTSGLVDVRCELDINVGDCVVSNAYGYAKKAGSDYGYKVLGRETKDGVEYAVIALGVQADVVNELGVDLDEIREQVDANYTNIISAVNLANQAYNKVSEIDVSNKAMSDKVDDAVGKVDQMGADVDDLSTQVSNSALISAQAKAIAESAATSAVSMRNEAVEKSNEALAETSELRRELEKQAGDMQAGLDNAGLRLDAVKEELDTTRGELRGSIDDAVGDLEDLKSDLMPLATWPNGTSIDRAESFSGFVTRADEGSALLATMVGCNFDEGETLAGFMQEATDTHALVSGVAEYQAKDKDGNPIGEPSVAGFIAQVDANTATVQSIAGKGGSIAGLQAQADGNSASITTLASQTIGEYETVEAWDTENKETDKKYYAKDTKNYYYYKNNQWVATQDIIEAGLDGAIAGVKSTADANSADLAALASYQAKDENGNPIYGVAGIMAHVDKNTAEVSMLAKHDFDGGTGAAGVVAQVDANKSELDAVATRTFTKDGKTVTGLAGLNAQVTENESNISLVSSRVSGKYTVIPETVEESKRDNSKIYASYNNTSKVTTYYYYSSGWKSATSFSSIATISTGIIYYVSTNKLYWYYENNTWKSTADAYVAGLPSAIAGIQVVTDDNSSSINSLTSWSGDTNISMARIEQKADANGAYIQSTVSNMDKYSVGPHSQAYGFTLEQAASIFDGDIIYAPTTSHTEEYKYSDKAEEVDTWNTSGKEIYKIYYAKNTKRYYYYYNKAWTYKTDIKEIPKYSRTFTPRYLYKWGDLTTYPCGWTTIDKDYNDTDKTNTSAPAVYFENTFAPACSGTFGYWYTNGQTLTGTAAGYEPFTLYKWSTYATKANDGNDTTDSCWTPVATLAGNSSNRAVSQIRQDANSIELRVTNTEGSYAGLRADLTDTNSSVQQLSTWRSGEEEKMASVRTVSDNDGASVVISALQRNGDTVEEMAGLVLNVAKDSSGRPTSALSIDADSINFEADNYIIDADHIEFSGQKLNIRVDSTNIEGTLTIGQLPDSVAETGDIPTEEEITTITNNTIKTTDVVAENLTVKAANIDGTLSIGQLDNDTANKIKSAISSTVIEYALSSSATSAPTSGWSTTAPSWQEGKYMWQRTTINYTDTTKPSTVTTTCIQGAKGGNGDSVTVSSIQYQAGDSATTAPTGTWSDSVVSVAEGQYLWTKTTFSDGSVAYGVAKQGASGTSVTGVVTQYCVSTNKSTAPTSGWVNNFDNVLTTYYANKKANPSTAYYIWSREEVSYSGGNPPTYSTATVNSASSFIASWCDVNDTTKINGAHIATGTVDAEAINVTDLKAFDADIAGWTIGDKGIYKDNAGILCNGGECASLVNDGEFSRVVFSAGTSGLLGGGFREKQFTFTSYKKWSDVIVLEDDEKNDFFISYAKCLTTEKRHSGSGTENVRIKILTVPSYTTTDGTFYSGKSTLTLFPTWVLKEHIAKLECDNSDINLSYDGNGVVTATCTSSMPGGIVVGTITYEYSFLEEIDVRVGILGKLGVSLSFIPKIPNVEYVIEVEYLVEPNGQNFKVLQDGSLYANSAYMVGTGSFEGKIIATNSEFEGEVKATRGNFGNLTIEKDGIYLTNSENDGISLLDDGYLSANNIVVKNNFNAGKISGTVEGSGYLLLDDESPSMQNVHLSLTTSEEVGSLSIFSTVLKEGSVTATIEANPHVTQDLVFNVFAQYQIDGDAFSLIVRSQSATMFAGQDNITVTFPYYIEEWHGLICKVYTCRKVSCTCRGVILPCNFTQPISKTPQIASSANFVPKSDGLMLGTNTQPWEAINAQNLFTKTSTWGSDRRLKDNIENIDHDFSEQLIKGLVPKSYEFKSALGETHYGFIAQEVEELLCSIGANPNEAGIVSKPIPDEPGGENKYYSLNYIDLIAPMVSVIQRLSKRVEELEEKLNNTQ